MQGGDTMALLNSLWPFVLMGGIFYFMLWKPQKREQQKRQDSLMMGGDGCIFHCSCCRDIYDSSILYICIFSEVYRFLIC